MIYSTKFRRSFKLADEVANKIDGLNSLGISDYFHVWLNGLFIVILVFFIKYDLIACVMYQFSLLW